MIIMDNIFCFFVNKLSQLCEKSRQHFQFFSFNSFYTFFFFYFQWYLPTTQFSSTFPAEYQHRGEILSVKSLYLVSVRFRNIFVRRHHTSKKKSSQHLAFNWTSYSFLQPSRGYVIFLHHCIQLDSKVFFQSCFMFKQFDDVLLQDSVWWQNVE